MPIPYAFGVGVGLVDKSQIDANFQAVAAGTSSTPVNGVIARAGGTQALATQLPSTLVVRVTVCATAGDSVALPLANSQRIILINSGAASLNVFAFNGSSDTINGTAGTTAFALATGKTAQFISAGLTFWHVLASA